jgi:hypothetical protein
VVKGYYNAHLAPIQPPSVLVVWIAEARAAVPLTKCITGPSAPASSSVIQTDDPPPRAASPLPYTEPGAPDGDIPMIESMEALYIEYTLPPGEVEMHDISWSPHPQPRDWEDFNEPNMGLRLET